MNPVSSSHNSANFPLRSVVEPTLRRIAAKAAAPQAADFLLQKPHPAAARALDSAATAATSPALPWRVSPPKPPAEVSSPDQPSPFQPTSPVARVESAVADVLSAYRSLATGGGTLSELMAAIRKAVDSAKATNPGNGPLEVPADEPEVPVPTDASASTGPSTTSVAPPPTERPAIDAAIPELIRIDPRLLTGSLFDANA